jgi:hypothetical protein
MLNADVGHMVPMGVTVTDSEDLQVDRPMWAQLVYEAAHGKCANCGGEHKLKPRLIVPEEAGGKLLLANSVLLCRACELASSVSPKKVAEQGKRLVNIWVSDRLYKKLQERRDVGHTSSMGALVRYMMGRYVADQARFDDLASYQDAGSDVRLNIWVESDLYSTFKTIVDGQGMTVTTALKALFCMYEAEASPLVDAAGRNKT